MKHFTKHLIAFLLTLAMVLSLLPTVAFAAGSASDDLWADIIAYENDHIIRTRGINDTVTAADYAALSGDIAEMVMASDDYKPGTCTYDGTNAMFFWEDADGEPQGYSPELRARFENGSKGTPSTSAEDEYVSYATKGGTTTGRTSTSSARGTARTPTSPTSTGPRARALPPRRAAPSRSIPARTPRSTRSPARSNPAQS